MANKSDQSKEPIIWGCSDRPRQETGTEGLIALTLVMGFLLSQTLFMIPHFPEFKRLELSDKNEIDIFTKDFPAYSDFNSTSLWCWDIHTDVRVSWLLNNLVVRFNDYLTGKPFYSFLGENRVHETATLLIEYSKLFGGGEELRLVPGITIATLDKKIFDVEEDTDSFDYIYDMRELSECSGAQYEKIRFFTKKFTKKYPEAEVKVVTSLHEIKDGIDSLESIWKEHKIIKDGYDHSQNESMALGRIFGIDIPNTLAICIFYERRLIAFSICELLADSTWALSHFAKADTSFSGIYTFLFKTQADIFAGRNIRYFNFEQDLGIEGLRRSKTSLRPVGFLKKFTVSIKK